MTGRILWQLPAFGPGESESSLRRMLEENLGQWIIPSVVKLDLRDLLPVQVGEDRASCGKLKTDLPAFCFEMFQTHSKVERIVEWTPTYSKYLLQLTFEYICFNICLSIHPSYFLSTLMSQTSAHSQHSSAHTIN